MNQIIEIKDIDKKITPMYNIRTPRYKGRLVCTKIPVFSNLDGVTSL
jgi:hypothetical protein